MCGIGGVVFKKPLAAEEVVQKLVTMSKKLEHRGPDDAGITLFGVGGNIASEGMVSAGILHRRLSIIDLSSDGHQPMSSADGKYTLSFNGEIYNYKELKAELESKGVKFKTKTDTEVLLHAYIKWGNNMYNKLEGMWAFSLWDKNKGLLILSRDRSGVKPLYYSIEKGQLVFASELKAFKPLVSTKPNYNFLYQVLVHNQFVYKNQSPLQNICEVEPSHYMEFNWESFSLANYPYYQPQVNGQAYQNIGISELEEKSQILYEVLDHSVNIHARSDVPIGTCLSGGFDSGTLVALLHKNGIQKFTAFSSVFPGFKDNEEDKIRSMVKKYDLTWQTSFPNSHDFETHFEDLVYTQEYPLLSTSTFAQYMLMKSVSETDVRVLLDGQGADELLAGYSKYLDLQPETSSFINYQKQRLKQKLKTSHATWLTSKIFETFYWDYDCLKPEWINEFSSPLLTPENPDLNSQLFFDFFKGNLGLLLRTEDRNSMRFSIESRVPFADTKALMDFSFALNAGYKIHMKHTKALLKTMTRIKDLLTPSTQEQKNKLGYSTPSNQWLWEKQDFFLTYLDNIPQELIDRNDLKNKWRQQVRAGKSSNQENLRLFKWVTLGAWFKLFN